MLEVSRNFFNNYFLNEFLRENHVFFILCKLLDIVIAAGRHFQLADTASTNDSIIVSQLETSNQLSVSALVLSSCLLSSLLHIL